MTTAGPTRRTVIAGAAAGMLSPRCWTQAAFARVVPGGDTRRLRFAEPARAWLEALPVGNGRIGAMVFGGIGEERIQLNHKELWSGCPADDDRPESLAALSDVRRLLFAGRYAEANALAQARMMVPMDMATYGSYQMLGDLLLGFDHGDAVEGYERTLDMASGEVGVVYTVGGHRYTRTILCSHPDGVLAIWLTTTAPGGLDATVQLRRTQDAVVTQRGTAIHLRGRPMPHGVLFAADLACTADGGAVTATPGCIRITGARTVTLLLTAATDLLAPDPVGQARTVLAAAQVKVWPALVATHRADHRPLFDAVSLHLAPASDASAPAPIAQGGDEHALVERYFNVGRYLLIASSRPGSLPANLQGLWADGFAPPWGADYHLNINLQMNYWPAEVCGLGALTAPLFLHAERLLPHARKTARVAYGCTGAAAHYTSNPWGHTALDGQLQWGMWPEGLAWLSLHFWEHYRYGGDGRFLRDHAWPMLKACAEFTLDYLVAHPTTSKLVAGPATSPENSYRLPDGRIGEISMGPAMSQSIAYAVLSRCRDAAIALGGEGAMAGRCDQAIARLQRLRIGADGRIMEWPEPFQETEVGHRHISHLFGLYPGYEIDPDTTPALADAARRTLSARLAGGGGQTGWSAAWLTMFRARLGEGDQAWAMLRKLFRESTARNYFDTHPADQAPIFQIDGNLGATAAIVEMLVQSHDGCLRILPALPGAWGEGRVRGVRARGGVAVDIDWRGGIARRVTLRVDRDVAYTIVPPPHQVLTRIARNGRALPVDGAPFRLKAGRYTLVFTRIGDAA